MWHPTDNEIYINDETGVFEYCPHYTKYNAWNEFLEGEIFKQLPLNQKIVVEYDNHKIEVTFDVMLRFIHSKVVTNSPLLTKEHK